MIRVHAITHRGTVREQNEDRIVVGRFVIGSDIDEPVVIELADGECVAVVDGLGGAAFGDVAAALAANILASRPVHDDDIVERLHAANQALYDACAATPALTGMGATVAGVVVGSGEAIVFNVGDARAYAIDDQRIARASVDDSSETRPGVVTASLGGLSTFAEVEPHVFVEPAESRGFLLASDGLTCVLDDAAIEALVFGTPEQLLVEELLQAALEAGAPDNVSICVVRWLP